MLWRQIVLFATLVVVLLAAAPANAAGPGPAATVVSFWEHVTETVIRVWVGGASLSQKASEHGPMIDPQGGPGSAAEPQSCEQGLTIDPSGCPYTNPSLLREGGAGAIQRMDRGR